MVREDLGEVSHQAVYDVLRALTAADDGGFAIDEAEVIYWGRCPQCRTAPTPEPVS